MARQADINHAITKAWESGNLEYLMHDAQLRIYNNIKNFSKDGLLHVNLCSRRFGKSYLSMLIAVMHCLTNKEPNVLIVSSTIKQAVDIYTPLFKWLMDRDPDNYISRMKSESKYKVKSGYITVTGWAEVESLRGQGATLIICDEVGVMAGDMYEYIIKQVLSPMLLHSMGNLIFNLTPPKILDHPVVTQTIPQAKALGTFHLFTIYDNPLLNEEQIQKAIEDCGGVDTVSFRREYLCEILPDEAGLVVPTFSETKHTIHEGKHTIKPRYQWIVCDVGGKRDKTAILVFGKSVLNSIVVMEEIILNSNTFSRAIGEYIKTLMLKYDIPVCNCWIDAHGQTLVDIYEYTGMRFNMPMKQDRDSAIRALNSAFFMNEIYIQENCPHTIKNLRSGAWNKHHTDFEWSDEFGHNDALMAVVYGYRMKNHVTPPIYTSSSTTIVLPSKKNKQPQKIQAFWKPNH